MKVILVNFYENENINLVRNRRCENDDDTWIILCMEKDKKLINLRKKKDILESRELLGEKTKMGGFWESGYH